MATNATAGQLTRMWWLFVAHVVVALLLGISVLVAGSTRPALANFIAVYWVVGAFLTLF